MYTSQVDNTIPVSLCAISVVSRVMPSFCPKILTAFAVTRVELGTLILSNAERERQIHYDMDYIQNIIHGANEHICRKETVSWTWRTDMCFPRGREREWDALSVWG